MRYALVVPAILAACATAAPLPSPEDVIESTLDTITNAVDTDTVTDFQKDVTNAVDEVASAASLDALNLKRDTEDAIGLDVALNGNKILTRDTENAMDGIDTAVDANVDVLKRAEDITINDLTLHNVDVLPNVNLQNIARSEDASIDSIDIPVGVPTLTILRRGDGNGEVVSDNGNGLLGLDLLNLKKRDNEILTDGDSVLGLGISLKRDDALLTDGDETTNGGGLLGLNILKTKRDDALLDGDGDTSSLLGITIPVKRDNALTNAKSDNKPVDIALKRDTSDIIDTNQIGDDSLLGLLKRKEDTSVGGIGGFDVGTPVLDIVNL